MLKLIYSLCLVCRLLQKKLLPSENGKIYEAGSSVKEINDKKIRITLSDGKYDIKILND